VAGDLVDPHRTTREHVLPREAGYVAVPQDLKPPAPARPASGAAGVSAEREDPSSEAIWAGVPAEPPVGFEPTTYA
jgi:hypothetical protein